MPVAGGRFQANGGINSAEGRRVAYSAGRTWALQYRKVLIQEAIWLSRNRAHIPPVRVRSRPGVNSASTERALQKSKRDDGAALRLPSSRLQMSRATPHPSWPAAAVRRGYSFCVRRMLHQSLCSATGIRTRYTRGSSGQASVYAKRASEGYPSSRSPFLGYGGSRRMKGPGGLVLSRELRLGGVLRPLISRRRALMRGRRESIRRRRETGPSASPRGTRRRAGPRSKARSGP